ncbi:MAG: pyrroline-5-carboxylate reductase [Alphaproteobacteria bacterium RIFOXYD12_FULL_60_8]|nr:MAG: pyrroline-5-carboxylate reductase [Alphaproteobacteria bacterium RIFOXYD12_FULL_60_8]
MQTQNKILDDISRLANSAMGALSGVKAEADAMVRNLLERRLADMNLVTREEFEAVKAMAAEARMQQEKLNARVQELEAALGKKPARAPKSK